MKQARTPEALDLPSAASPQAAAAFDCDVAIVGAGPVGLALACMLARRSATAHMSVTLVDARDGEAARRDPRTLALSHGSRILLEPHGWPADATPIEKIHVSQRGHFGRAVIEHHEHGLPALGYVLRYGSLAAALRQSVDRLAQTGGRIRILEHHTALHAAQDATGVTLALKTGGDTATLRSRLVIHAEGGVFSADTGSAATVPGARVSPVVPVTSGAQGAPVARHGAERLQAMFSRDYAQTAIVGSVRTASALARVAWERFTPEGPIALLPCGESGDRTADYALVWCQSPSRTQERMQMSDAAFLAALHEAFGDRVGQFTHIEGRATFALGLNRRNTIVEGRSAAIGNAAQTLHPVAGQGLNLGLRDAQVLAGSLAALDATPAALSDFSKRRHLDRAITIGATDALARAFTVDIGPLAGLRGIALAALDLAPFAKRMLARQMMFGQRR